MKVVLQRSLQARVEVDGQVVGQVDHGLVALVGIANGDTQETVQKMAAKTVQLRVFADAAGKMNRNVLEAGGGILAISQFTLLADCRRGRRPAFTGAAAPDLAKTLYELFVRCLRDDGVNVACGIFAADMKITLTNDGPVTIILDSNELFS
jgi:D-tyrosyl-tRNA(Tyr) deacylase